MKINRNGKAAIFTCNDFLKLLKNYAIPSHKLLLQIAFYTGERWGAIVQLRVEDVYSDVVKRIPRKAITFRKSTRKGQVTRTIEVASELSSVLKGYQPPSHGWLFPSPYKDFEHLTYRAAAAYFTKCLYDAGLHRCGCFKWTEKLFTDNWHHRL
jgi:integrase/recombinase XerD